MNKKVIHIGLGKAASSTLQKKVFPAFCNSRQIKFFPPDEISTFFDHPNDGFVLPKEFLASFEMLMGPHTKWDQYLKKNLECFGADTTVIIILRRPSGYLRSVFQQISHHSGVLIPPEVFFDARSGGLSKTLDPRKFEQTKLVKIYAENFQHVIVQKFETIAGLEFL